MLGGRVSLSQLHVWPKRGAGRLFGTIEGEEGKSSKGERGRESVLFDFCVVGTGDYSEYT